MEGEKEGLGNERKREGRKETGRERERKGDRKRMREGGRREKEREFISFMKI